MSILAIDPGTTESAYVLVGQNLRTWAFDKVPNDDLLTVLHDNVNAHTHVAIEMIASYGMPVGANVFETCVWIGRFMETVVQRIGTEPTRITRSTVRVHHCHSTKATDATVRQALVDRFACGARNYGKGTKSEPGWFYGFRDDIWSAYAVAVYAADQETKRITA